MKRIVSLLLSLAMAFSLAACTAAPAGGPAVSPPPVQTPDPEARYPVTVTDQAGRTVTIESEPQRIISGYYISTSLLIALGLEDKLVGVEAKADKRAIYRLSAPELADLPSVGTAKEFDLEGCAALEPDLVILPLKLKSAAETLERLDIPVLLVNPESRALMDEARDLVAQATDTSERAGRLEEFSRSVEEELEQALSGVQRPRVYLASNSSLLSAAGGEMYQSDLIGLAGGENVAQELEDAYWAEVSYEQLLAWDPEYIILASDASYTCEDVLGDPNLAGCSAVAGGRVYQMPNRAEAWDSPVPGGVLGAFWLASVLHPEQVSRDRCDERIEDFYGEFYGFSYHEA